MSDWTHRAVVVVPLALLESGVAQALGRCFDPDTGGAMSFDSIRAGAADVATHAVCDVLLVESMAATMQALQVYGPAALHDYCLQDHALRWPDIEPPSLSACTAFLGAAAIVTQPRAQATLPQVLAGLGLQIIRPAVLPI